MPRTNLQGGNSTDQPVTHDLASSERRGLRASRLGRTALAVGIGLRGFAFGLLPARCEACRGAIGRSDARCWICGFPTGTPRLPPSDET